MSHPAPGDRILVVRPQWMRLILAKEKTYEIRGRPLKAGEYFMGHRGLIQARIVLGSAVRIQSTQQWQALRPQHRVADNVLPYKQTWGSPILEVEEIERRVRYIHPRGAIGLVRYKPM